MIDAAPPLRQTIVELIASAGVGGVLALVVFWFYRQDSTRAAELLADANAKYAALLDRVLTALGEPPKK